MGKSKREAERISAIESAAILDRCYFDFSTFINMTNLAIERDQRFHTLQTHGSQWRSEFAATKPAENFDSLFGTEHA